MKLPQPPRKLAYRDVQLSLQEIVPGDDAKEFVPYYHFRIVNCDGHDAGHVNFRVGETRHVRLFAGHIGFAVAESFRGRGFAFQACRALEPFVATIYPVVVVTCNPDNIASRKTIERLGAVFINEIDVPPDDPMYQNGARRKRRYEWTCSKEPIGG